MKLLETYEMCLAYVLSLKIIASSILSDQVREMKTRNKNRTISSTNTCSKIVRCEILNGYVCNFQASARAYFRGREKCIKLFMNY